VQGVALADPSIDVGVVTIYSLIYNLEFPQEIVDSATKYWLYDAGNRLCVLCPKMYNTNAYL